MATLLADDGHLTQMDALPRYQRDGFEYGPGRPRPFGATVAQDGINFSVFSSHATACTLTLFKRGAKTPLAELPFEESFRTGDVYAMQVFDLDYRDIEYGFRMEGPYDPANGHRFDASAILLDPYAKEIGASGVWGQGHDRDDPYPYRARPFVDDFDWGGDRQLNIPIEDLVIYEMHLRGFTAHPSSGVESPGSYTAVIEKIPYLKRLGVNCIELMPIFEFDELDNQRVNPVTGEQLMNFWGYNPIGFFAPNAAYAAGGRPADELKSLVKACHRNGIEVWLDVVLNHTAEGDDRGPTISYRGIDNAVYYLLGEDGDYHNYTGTGNTFNCNHPIVRVVLLDCLRYWVSEFHIDGFRFDLASSMGRDPQGNPLSNPPLLEVLAYDPILAQTKLIAEAWDAAGLYQVGTFPAYGRWAEWNDRFRDDLRRFVKGDGGMVGAVAARIQGSPDIYGERGPRASVNFVTAHDGFSLRDLVSYNRKHNLINGEFNRDGADQNHSWNCGSEGETDDAEINGLRHRQMKNFLSILMVSQGAPMLLMGDEIAHSKGGNNNSYCHDSALNWFDWEALEGERSLFRFLRNLIAFRAAHPALRRRAYFRHDDVAGSGYPDISFHGRALAQPDWSWESRQLGILLCGEHAAPTGEADDMIYIILNAHWETAWFDLPALGAGQQWHVAVNTMLSAPEDSHPVGEEPALPIQKEIMLGARSVAILAGR